MISREQIIEAAKEYDVVLENACGCSECRERDDFPKIEKFAQHFYKLGLLDAADACDHMGDEEEIRQMAREVGK